MLYFFHHYELPLILRQVQLQNLLMRTASSHGTGGGGVGAAAAAAGPADAASADGDRMPGSEAPAETETMDRDSEDSPPASETPSDDSEIESVHSNNRSVPVSESTAGARAEHPPTPPLPPRVEPPAA